MRTDGSGHDFDLLSLFSTKGFYSDGNRDGILDGIESSIIIPQSWSGKGLAWLASKLILFSCGASFPLVYLDGEIEQKKSLVAPILAGPSRLTHELMKTGKFKPPALENAWGVVEAVPKAFNKSSALVIHAPDNLGLEKTLSFLGLTFPFFEEYRDGSPQLQDARQEFERFLKGENGSAEAFFDLKLREIAEDLKEKDLETFEANLILPRENKKYGEAIQKRLESLLHAGGLAVKLSGQKQGKLLFEKEKAFPWEATEAVTLALEKTKTLKNPQGLKISLGISESHEVRAKIRAELGRGLQDKNAPAPE
ncbi:hypothetical protein FDZ71_17605, partial [bacterium]